MEGLRCDRKRIISCIGYCYNIRFNNKTDEKTQFFCLYNFSFPIVVENRVDVIRKTLKERKTKNLKFERVCIAHNKAIICKLAVSHH